MMLQSKLSNVKFCSLQFVRSSIEDGVDSERVDNHCSYTRRL